jgi:aspartyl-tRNA(Asn)/glutamyl-tRNA(Gln) amidotransferase subunit A
VFAKTIVELSDLLRKKVVCATELADLFLQRIERFNPQLNALIALDPDKTMAMARAADEKIARGEANVLTGVPLIHKNIFCVKGWPTTCGSKMLANFVAPYSATIVDKLEQEGMVMLGMANMDEFAMGSSNETSFFGPVRNPWDMNAVPGGSSGGSAAAVAARLAPCATGTDTGGSIRQPAALCGISGLKPTYGLLSRFGMVAFASSLDQAGPMAKTALDLALLLNAMAGFDDKDSTSIDRPKEDYTRDLDASLRGRKVGVPKEYWGDGIAPDVRKTLEEALQVLKGEGAEIVEVSLPNAPLSIPVYYILAPAEASSNLARYDGVRYGFRAGHYEDLIDMYKKTRAMGFGAEVKRRIMIGTYVLSAGYYDAYYLKAQKARRLIAEDFNKVFSEVEVLVAPTSPTVAFDLGEKAKDPIAMYLSDINTIAVNLAGLPALSVPAGFGNKGRPVGLQWIAPRFAENRLLNFAHRFQMATDWHLRMPEIG